MAVQGLEAFPGAVDAERKWVVFANAQARFVDSDSFEHGGLILEGAKVARMPVLDAGNGVLDSLDLGQRGG